MSKTLMPTEELGVLQWQGVRKDDFETYTDTALWTKTASDGGSSVALATTNLTLGYGVLTLTTGATLNNKCNIATTSKLFKMLSDQQLYLEAKVLWNEANTNNANIAFGVADSMTTTLLQDSNGAPLFNSDGAMIYKQGGQLFWGAASNVNSGTIKNDVSTYSSALGSSKWQRLGISINPISTTRVEISYTVNDLPLFSNSSSTRPGMNIIKHVWDATTTAQLSAFVFVKAGSGSSEVLQLDYAGWAFRRPPQ